MYEFASVSRAEKVEILQRTKRGLHGAQSAFYYDRFPMLSKQFARTSGNTLSHRTWSYFLFDQLLEAYLMLGL